IDGRGRERAGICFKSTRVAIRVAIFHLKGCEIPLLAIHKSDLESRIPPLYFHHQIPGLRVTPEIRQHLLVQIDAGLDSPLLLFQPLNPISLKV
ncbi:hypothetical protein AMTR_s01993p00007760, partial [Amborella trichopoda]